MLSQASIASVSLGLASTETFLVNHGAAKDRPAIVSSSVAFYARALNTFSCHWPAVVAIRSLFIKSVGPAISKLLHVGFIAKRSLEDTAAAITLQVATIDMSTAKQRMMLACTCHSSVSTEASCLPSRATSYCCRGKDTNELLCTSDPTKTTACLECTNEHDVLWLRLVFTVASGACQCHSCQCATLQRTSACTETFKKRLPRLIYATAGVSSQCWCFTADPVSSTGYRY